MDSQVTVADSAGLDTATAGQMPWWARLARVPRISRPAAPTTVAWWAVLAAGALGTGVFAVGELLTSHRPPLDLYFRDLAIAPTYLVAAFLFWQRPNHLVPRRMLVASTCFALHLGLGEVLSLLWFAAGPQPWYWILATGSLAGGLAGWAAFIGLMAVFPDGAYHRRYERWIVWAAVILAAAGTLLPLGLPDVPVDPDSIWAQPIIRSPLQTRVLAWLPPIAGYYRSSWILLVPAGLLMIVRYRRLPHLQRLQVKWVLWAATSIATVTAMLVCTYYGGLSLGPFSTYWLTELVMDVTLVLAPFGVAIAVLRHRLLDIDLVIRRSLVYGVLWLSIAAIYLGLAAALGLAVWQRLPITLAILLTTGATIAFQPARSWLEQLADRWVFGKRVSGYELLRRLGAALETSVEVGDLGTRLASAIRAALDMCWVRVSAHRTVGDTTALDPIGWDGISPGQAATAVAIVPLAHGNQLVGVIECGAKMRGELTETDEDLLATLGRQAALALRNARLAADLSDRLQLLQVQTLELAESRARIVRAQDAERKRIERDLHDGVQQRLINLAARLRRAAQTSSPDMKQAVQDLAREAEETVFALQDFSRGIYPSLLADEGLAPALWSHAQRLPVRVELDVGPDTVGQRFGREREAALYFVALEAIVNSQKHASAQRIQVILRRQGTDLRLAVVDDGCGLRAQSPSRGTGLQNMRDRVATLGGSLEIESWPGLGTRVVATIPDGAVCHSPGGDSRR